MKYFMVIIALYFNMSANESEKKVDENKPHKIKAYFIKSDEVTMENFKIDLEKLFEKYQDLENLDCEETYGFISVLAPYKLNK